MARIDPFVEPRALSSDDATRRILRDPAFKDLVQRRTSFAWTLSAAMVLIYFVFVFLVAFAKPLMATTIGSGPASLGIILGLIVIVSAIVLTGVYVRRANGEFDSLVGKIGGRR